MRFIAAAFITALIAITTQAMPDNLNPRQRSTSIIALNIVSSVAQVGQFGLGTTLLPIALEARGASAQSIGIASSAFWLGMLLGLLAAGQLTRRLGYRKTAILGLLVSAASFMATPYTAWQWWALPAAAIGFGLGLRWIANETWLYRLAPAHARGRIVGIHETLISIAAVVGPLIIVALGAMQPAAFWVAAATILISIPPLFMATILPAVDEAAMREHDDSSKLSANTGRVGIVTMLVVSFGGLIAGLGGWMEGALLSLLPVYSTDIGLSPRDAAWLFTLLGAGAMLCQLPLGWLADRKGVLWSTSLCLGLGFIAVMVSLVFSTSFYALALTAFILGGITAGMLTLGIIWATQHSSGAALTNRVRQVSILYTTLSAAGPFVGGFIVSHSSSLSLFWQQLALLLIMAALVWVQPADKASSSPAT